MNFITNLVRCTTRYGRIAISLIAICCCIQLFSQSAWASQGSKLTFKDVTILFISKKGCVSCKTASSFLGTFAKEDDWLDVETTQFESSDKAQRIHQFLLKAFGFEATDFPVVVIGSHVVIGYVDHETTGMEIIGFANYCRLFLCADIFEAIKQDDQTIVNVCLSSPTRICSAR